MNKYVDPKEDKNDGHDTVDTQEEWSVENTEKYNLSDEWDLTWISFN